MRGDETGRRWETKENQARRGEGKSNEGAKGNQVMGSEGEQKGGS